MAIHGNNSLGFTVTVCQFHVDNGPYAVLINHWSRSQLKQQETGLIVFLPIVECGVNGVREHTYRL